MIPAVVMPGQAARVRSTPDSPAAAMRRPPLPLPTLAVARSRADVYGLVTLNSRGRIADQATMKVLDWAPGLRVSIRERHGLIVVSADEQGVFSVTKEGHLRLPAVVRQWCGLAAGDRVLIVAEPAYRRLVVHPPAKLDEMITQAHGAAFGSGHE
ncbi:hypothetical protein Micau_4152 [Micromonospora aurantiaca ATCC 27029]|nr:hypothetical protein Micau_4152 [Micromonospora aurantiaca ATCC 27029]